MGEFRRFFSRIFRHSFPQADTKLGIPQRPPSARSISNNIVSDGPQTTVADDAAQGGVAVNAIKSDDSAVCPSELGRPGLPFKASRTSINQPSIMGEHVEICQQNSSLFVKLRLEHIILGAEFDSSECDYPLRCHRGTRTQFLSQLQAHIRSGTRIVWIRGPAGVGKTVIMRTLAETLSPHFTCTTLFFSRPDKRDDPKKVFPTLAYGLAVANSSYRRYLEENLAVDPCFLAKTIEEQFKRLFVTPFTNNHINTGSKPWVVFLDGLDECNGEQSRIVGAISESVFYHANSTPFVWIIASRPEAHLDMPFAQVQAQVRNFWKLEIPVDSDEVSRDVERYLRVEFNRIRRNYPNVIPSRWPSESDLSKFAKAASGVFVFASVSVAYIAEDNPVVRFNRILSFITRNRSVFESKYPAPTKNPFEMLDLLYETIMSDIPTELLPTAKAIMSFNLLQPSIYLSASVRGQPSLIEVCNILGLEQHAAYAALRGLSSVLTFPAPEAPDGPIQFLHTSFSDFLKDPSRSRSYHIDPNQEIEKIWWCFVRITKQSITSPDDVVLSWECETVDNNELRRYMLNRAEIKWLEVLVGGCHAGCASSGCTILSPYQLSPSTLELVESFREIYPILFRPRHARIGWFCDWLSYHAPLALRQMMILKRFRTRRLDEFEADQMFDGFHTRRWGYYAHAAQDRGPEVISMLDLADIDRSQWNAMKQNIQKKGKRFITDKIQSRPGWRILGQLMEGQHLFNDDETPFSVTVIGTDATNYFAVVMPSMGQASNDIAYLIIPYGRGSIQEYDLDQSVQC